MAESITPWLANSLGKHVQGMSCDVEGRQIAIPQLQDTPFLKGSKVQIVRFLGFLSSGQRIDLENGNINGEQQEQQQQEEENDDDANHLWAIVSDRKSWTCAKFSKECVRLFDATHTRRLISMRGAIIGLRQFRPSVSTESARLFEEARSNRARVTGPFAGVGSALPPRLYLDIEGIHLWGSVNEPIFWQTKDLQCQLLGQITETLQNTTNGTLPLVIAPTLIQAFQKWYTTVNLQQRRQLSATRAALHS